MSDNGGIETCIRQRHYNIIPHTEKHPAVWEYKTRRGASTMLGRQARPAKKTFKRYSSSRRCKRKKCLFSPPLTDASTTDSEAPSVCDTTLPTTHTLWPTYWSSSAALTRGVWNVWDRHGGHEMEGRNAAATQEVGAMIVDNRLKHEKHDRRCS